MVEDHLDSRRAMVAWLRSYGYEVADAATVAEAIAKSDGQAIALLNYHLPDGSGLDVLEHLRQQPHPTRVAFMTASYETKSINPMLTPVDTIFRKPLDLDKLMDWIKDSAGTGPGVTSDAYRESD